MEQQINLQQNNGSMLVFGQAKKTFVSILTIIHLFLPLVGTLGTREVTDSVSQEQMFTIDVALTY